MSTKLATIIADFSSQLTTEIAIGGTAGTVASIVDDDGVALPTGNYFFTIDGGNSSKEHFFAAFNAGAMTSMFSVSRQGAQTSGAVRLHRVGATVTITDFASILYMAQYFTGAVRLDSTVPLRYDGTATVSNANDLATKAYVDGVAIAGGANASSTVKGISKLDTDPVSATNPIAVGTNSAKLTTLSGNVLDGSTYKIVDSGSVGLTGASKVLQLTAGGKITTSVIDAGTGANQIVQLDSSSRLPAVNGSLLTNLPAQVGLGSWVAATADGNGHQVTTDGFVMATFTSSSNIQAALIRSDSASTPTTTRVSSSATVNTASVTLICPVKKNDYYLISGGTGSFSNVYFIPLGV